MEQNNEEKKGTPFWAMSPEEVLTELQTNKSGLQDDVVAKRRLTFGSNVIDQRSSVNRWNIFIEQFKNPLIVILLIASAITLQLGDIADALFIFAAVLVNVVLGFYQENKAETALAGLRSYIKERVRVIRGGREQEIDAEHIVPGDIVRLVQGTRIPADGRLITVNELAVDESILTGESLAKHKQVEQDSVETALVDMGSMLFGGTLITEGTGVMAVTATGVHTELGKIASMVAESKQQKTPLQKAIATFAKKALYILGVLVALLFALGLYSGHDPFEMFLISVAVAVASVPEGLPIALTVILAVGVERLAKRKAVVRKLLAAETLGSTTLIMTDKTGTITQAKLKLAEIISSKTKEKVLSLALLNADVVVENPEDEPDIWRIVGDPLEAAIVRAAAHHKVLLSHVQEIIDPNANDEIEVLDRRPFNSYEKFSASYVRYGSQKFWSYLGAPEAVIENTDIDPEEKKAALLKVDTLAVSGYRVLAVAQDKKFLGLLAFRDPIRPGIRDTIEKVGQAGIKTVIATGDHAGTAEAIGKEAGILTEEHNDVLLGSEMQKMTDEELLEKCKTIRVFARVTPRDKLRLARLYQGMGEVVAMTGDGVNDAPALKAADIGVAVGSGTDVAKGAADLVILDDNFETIIAAIEEGRRSLSNIKKVIVYLLSDALNALVLIGGALIMGVTIPLTALQILWVNFFSDSFPAIAFAFEQGEDQMKKKPQRMLEGGIFDREMQFIIVIIGLATSILLFALYLFLLNMGIDQQVVRTFIFASFGFATLFVAFSVRSLDEHIFYYSPLSNKYLLGGVFVGVVLMFAGIYVPYLQTLLDTVPLSPVWLAAVFGVGIVNLFAVEMGKWVFIRK
jgi:Ca2+-transporting ATPase